MNEEDRQRFEAALADPSQSAIHGRIRAILAKDSGPGGAPPEIAARRQAMTHTPDEGASQDVIGASHEGETSAGDQRLASFNERVKHVGGGAKALGSAAIHPIGTMTNPHKRRELVRGVDDMVTLGYGQEASDALVNFARKHAAYPGQADAVLGPSMSEMAPEDAREAPGFRAGGQIGGMFMPGATSAVAKGGGKLAANTLGRIPTPGPLSGAAMGGARAALGYEASAPVIAGLHAGSSGHRLQAAQDAAKDPTGLALSVALGAAGGAGRGEATSIRSPQRESGRVIQDVAAAGGKIKPFGQPTRGGLYESPEMQNLPEGRQGVNALADKSATRIESANAARLKAAREQYGDTVDAVIMEHGDQPHPTTNAHAALDQMEAENTVKAGRPDAVVGDPGVHAAIGRVRSMLSQSGDIDEVATLANALKRQGVNPARLSPPQRQQILSSLPPDSPLIVRRTSPLVTAEDMVKSRKLVRQLANNAPMPTEQRVYQRVLSGMDQDAEAIDPRIRGMNAEFSKAMAPIEQSNEIIFGKKGRDPEVSVAQKATGSARLGRIGDDTQSATVRDPSIQRFEALGPEYANETRIMRAKKAQEKLRRGEPETSTSIEKGQARGGRTYKRTVALGLALPGVGVPLGYALDKWAENPLANKIRLGLPASDVAGKLTGESGVGADAIGRLARKRGKKKREETEASP